MPLEPISAKDIREYFDNFDNKNDIPSMSPPSNYTDMSNEELVKTYFELAKKTALFKIATLRGATFTNEGGTSCSHSNISLNFKEDGAMNIKIGNKEITFGESIISTKNDHTGNITTFFDYLMGKVDNFRSTISGNVAKKLYCEDVVDLKFQYPSFYNHLLLKRFDFDSIKFPMSLERKGKIKMAEYDEMKEYNENNDRFMHHTYHAVKENERKFFSPEDKEIAANRIAECQQYFGNHPANQEIFTEYQNFKLKESAINTNNTQGYKGNEGKLTQAESLGRTPLNVEIMKAEKPLSRLKEEGKPAKDGVTKGEEPAIKQANLRF